MIDTATVYPLRAVRALALHAQGLTTPNGAEPNPAPDAITEVVARPGCLQLDTLHVVQRSHYLAVWSRLGSYDPGDLDRLVYREPRRLFESWLHAACIVPLTEYRYRLPYMRRVRENPGKWSRRWLEDPGSTEILRRVKERIQREGPQSLSDFEYKGPKRDSWWDWRPAKQALEHLFSWGELMIADRVNFHKVYDLRERVLPDWVDTSEPTRAEMARHVLEVAARAFGVCKPNQIADYAHEIKRGEGNAVVASLIEDGVLVEIQARLSDGEAHTLVVHRQNLPLLERAADGALAARRTTFLNPFDSLFWPRGRDGQFWGFRQVLEAYKPAAQREWGYFCLPILHGDRLVGRFDPKMERDAGLLRVKALYLEPGVAADAALVAAVAGAMRDFMVFHGAQELVIERSEPAAFGEKLTAAL